MFYVSHWFRTALIPSSIAKRFWNFCKGTYQEAITNYYNRCIEHDPEGQAYHYWHRIKHPHSGFDVQQITDAKLSRLMDSLLEQGISKFAVDRFILELRRLVRTAHSHTSLI